MSFRFVTFLTDFGVEDDFVGVCRGVIRTIAPEATVIDLTHGIPPQAVTQGAIVLARATPYLPVAVHLAVVDPGVGSERRPVAVRTAAGRIFVGPDNGLLMLAADAEGVEAARALTNPRYHLARVSRTFHARDLFAPVAAHLAAGAAFADLGEEVDAAELVRVDVPRPEVGTGRLLATVLTTDRFGNLALNARREHLERLGLELGDWAELQFALEPYYARVAATYADAEPGTLILYEDSYGSLAIAIRDGNAARLTAAGPGDRVRIRPAEHGDVR
ncbi:MAG TPA: SAM-dependent chlorinase/fluorinase [Gaiellaceae bacterium]|nr:SAM-dependent chlorinase/fluorinase [Gaiellaceae bacterium]